MNKYYKLLLILLLSISLRVAAALYLGNHVIDLPGTTDQISYHTLALRVLNGHGFSFDKAWWPMTAAGAPTAHWSYLYTLYLVIVYAVFGPNPLAARLIQAFIVGFLHPFLTYLLTKLMLKHDSPKNFGAKQLETFLGVWDGIRSLKNPKQIIQLLKPRDNYSFSKKSNLKMAGPLSNVTADFNSRLYQEIPLIAAGLTAVYTYFIYYDATLMTEPFFIIGVLASLILTILLANRLKRSETRTLAIMLGIAISATVLLRQAFLIFLPILFGWFFLTTLRKYSWRSILSPISTSLIILVMAILPISIFNYARFGQFVPINTNTGFAFYWANHPYYQNRFIPASEMGNIYQDLVPSELHGLDEAALDRELLKRGISFVFDDPKRYVQLSLSRIPEYFKFWPDSSSSLISNISRVSSFALLLPFMLFGLLFPKIKISRSTGEQNHYHLPSAIILLYLFITIYSAIHILSWAQIRYRLPVDAVLVPFSAIAIAKIGHRMRGFFIKKDALHDTTRA